MDNRKAIIAENIRLLKDQRKLSMSELARRAGMPPPTVASFLKHPEEKNTTLDNLYSIADFFGVDLWGMLIPDFPFDQAKYNKIDKISENGYLLLTAFENAPDNVKYSILDAVAFSISSSDKGKSKQIKESIAQDNSETSIIT